MEDGAEQSIKIILWLCGGGSVLVTILWGYAIYRMQKLWRADDRTIKIEVAKLIEEQNNKIAKTVADNEKIINSATGRLDKEIDSLKVEDKTLHTRINESQKEMNQKIDREVELLATKIDTYNSQITQSLQDILNKLGVLEGKILK